MPRRLRVVYVDHVAQLSGAELALLRTLRALPYVDAHVILAEDGPLVDELRMAGLSVEILSMCARTRQLRKGSIRAGALPLRAVTDTARYSLVLARRLRQLRPDLVHTNSLKAGIYGGVAGRLAGVPVVWHVRDRIDEDYLPRAAVLLVRSLMRRLPAVLIANSRATGATVPAGLVCDVIPSPIEPSAPADPEPDEPRGDGPLVVGIVGRLAPWKGQDVFLRAFAEAFAGGPQRAVVVGAPLFGQEEVAYSDGLRALAGELGIGPRVDFRGHRADVASELRELDVLVHASTIAEPFGQVVAEGMAAGLAVLATAAGGPTEIVTDGVDGLLYPPGDVRALALLLRRVDADAGLRVRLGAAARDRAAAFSPAAVAERVMTAYERALHVTGRRLSPLR
jgi:glycosyltransferase involved in cell wall biosynthesis